MTDILTAEQVAELLHCTPETVREKTPHIIPGAKFGRAWVYSREMVVKAVERESMVVRCTPRALPHVPQATPLGGPPGL